ncbi:Beige/BEACH domain containing protein [Histomonas meleagridis]|uniref:Beige/BEACH domain containing protein n=1 Tax=Histomonas meleagridis TaxID=135588 RepID=UPI003559D3BE|nr:Beige/BEACH domain containing protein [Histomonas meleagridis]KAH0806723.1 Beige/BEACH domain containing protein [Histomonas meleagridis]
MFVNKDNFDLGIQTDNGDVELPKWAKTPMDLVYLNRKALESDFTSRNINHWIDMHFGVKQRNLETGNVYTKFMYPSTTEIKDQSEKKEADSLRKHCGQVPRQIFHDPHPIRNLQKQQQLQPKAYPIIELVDKKIISYKFIFKSKKTIGVFATGSNEIQHFSFGFGGQGIEATKTASFILQESISSNSLIINKYCLINVSNNKRTFQIIDFKRKTTRTSSSVFGEIVSVSYDEPLIITIGSDSVVYFWDFSDIRKPLISIESPHQEYISSAHSCVFDTAVLGTNDGFLDVISLRNGRIIQSIDLKGDKPVAIEISKSFGFIFVHSIDPNKKTSSLSLYNINGLLLKKIQLKDTVTSMITWENNEGFDFASVVTSNTSSATNKVFTFELYYMNLNENVFRSKIPISSLNYDKKNQIVIGVNTEGKLILFPYKS